MQDRANELLRISIPRTWVNSGEPSLIHRRFIRLLYWSAACEVLAGTACFPAAGEADFCPASGGTDSCPASGGTYCWPPAPGAASGSGEADDAPPPEPESFGFFCGGPTVLSGPLGPMVLFRRSGSAHGKIPNNGQSRTVTLGSSGSLAKNIGSPPDVRTSSLAASSRNSAAVNVPLNGLSPMPMKVPELTLSPSSLTSVTL